MGSLKKWRQLSGGSFYKFEEVGQVLEGTWQGTQTGKFGDNGTVEVFGKLMVFSLNAGLKDLLRVKAGTEIRLEYLGKQRAKNGNEFKAYKVEVAEDAEVADPDDPNVPF